MFIGQKIQRKEWSFMVKRTLYTTVLGIGLGTSAQCFLNE